jgi:hypothetical protein
MIGITMNFLTLTLNTEIFLAVKMMMFWISLSHQSAGAMVYCIKRLFQHRRYRAATRTSLNIRCTKTSNKGYQVQHHSMGVLATWYYK